MPDVQALVIFFLLSGVLVLLGKTVNGTWPLHLKQSNISSLAYLGTDLSQRPKEQQDEALLGRLTSTESTAHAARFHPQNVGISATVLAVEEFILMQNSRL